MTAQDAMRRINVIASHLWMVRTFLKHAEEIEDDPDRLRIPRVLFDFARAIETRYSNDDADGYVKMVRKKLPKLRAVADQFAHEVDEISSHTNFKQASLSLSGCVDEIDEVLRQLGPHSNDIL
jgi:hypothetical protein